ncbi:MAG: LDL receptor domain-containing protein [Candidatus Endonucleobacter bathymodioli]|uniref:LDL receptor domain-containing protein n=1 Tax=Candidatus Endonucleibacter bathymodioli TaxID=539814 RepID=A0AA90NSC5_9GAMM|nr:LDL receptor domain-containing protein [Candidatus Endonucleobacter bathymodioli]
MFFDNCKGIKYIKHFLCLPVMLALLVTSLAHATGKNCQHATIQPPVTMLLNRPNSLDKYLTVLRDEPVVNIHNFLKDIVWLERDDGENDNAYKKRTFFNKKHYQKFYNLYCVLSLQYYKGQSFTGFVKYMIYNEPDKVISRPLMEALFKLCNDYQDRPGITIGNMFAEVENKKHTDEDINAFLRYKANSLDAQYKALYPDDDTGTNKHSANSSADSSNKKRGASWFSYCSQSAFNCAQSIVKNVSSHASKAMYTTSFSALGILPVGAADGDQFICDDNKQIDEGHVCNGYVSCQDRSDESASNCCVGGENGVDITNRRCFAKDNMISGEKLFICNDMQTVPLVWRCDGENDCNDGSDEAVDGPNPACFSCANRTSIFHELRCNGANNCGDNSDEIASQCCKGGETGVDSISKMCVKNVDARGVNAGSDESWNYHINDTTFDTIFDTKRIVVSALSAGAVACAAYIGIMLVKYRGKKRNDGTLAWLFSPITEPVKCLCELRKSCASYLVPSRESDENSNEANPQAVIEIN